MSNMKPLEEKWSPTRDQLIDSMGRYLTQSLFLEIGYSSSAIYTLKDADHEYEGKIFPSMKRLYLEIADPTEYQFANMYLAGYPQWQRIVENKALKPFIEQWRFELEVKLRSEGVMAIRKHSMSKNPTAWQASKWLADKGWSDKGAGRPSKEDIEREKKVMTAVHNEFLEDERRLVAIK